MAHYNIDLTLDDNGTFLVSCPQLPEVTTFGEEEADALTHAAEAVEEALAARMARGEDIPPFTDYGRAGGHLVRLPLLTAAKISLQRIMLQEGLTRADLVRRLGWHREQVDRLFRLDHASRMDQIEEAFSALGVELDLQLIADRERADA